MTRRKRAKFRVGQVVRVGDYRQANYGRITQFMWTGKIMLEFWDADQNDKWSWDYDPKYLHPLTPREAGPR